MMRCLIVDDEPLAIQVLRSLAERTGGLEIVGTAQHARAAMHAIATLRPELVLLDIGMPGASGIDVARELRAHEQPPLVVFVTAYDHFAAQAFDLDVTDYVLKPVQQDRFARALGRAAERHAQRTDQAVLWLPYAGTMQRVPLTDVLQLDAERDYVRVVTADRTYLMRGTLTDLEQRLPPGNFLRVHRSTILRTDRISGLRHVGAGTWDILDSEGEPVRIGRSYLDQVRAHLGLPG
ncbi:response regulator transcription factor [Massilia arenosa]|uniref:Response regulator transcription factor n=1 Tax=Zemynaea arenosa TaxID=2561931 RepID=A0A4Y9SCZ2_9BURK|nr:LytTR family DNA-binding domain-containing protein [Massilia arenosa]TFW20397.1 response regulator transcription factor [Massilia arenosa]